MSKKIYIYQIYFPTSNKCYIGQTDNLQRRMKAHLRSGYLICKALYKYDNWEISVLHICKDRDVANTLEIEEIRNCNSVMPNGYNLTHGGEGEDTFTNRPNANETREKMRQIMMGNQHKKGKTEYTFTKEHCKKLSISNLGNQNGKGLKGHKHSEETKEKISQAALGRKHSEEAKAKMSKSRSGKGNPFYGKKHTEETKEKNRQAQIGKKQSEEVKANMRLAQLKRRAQELEQELNHGD